MSLTMETQNEIKAKEIMDRFYGKYMPNYAKDGMFNACFRGRYNDILEAMEWKDEIIKKTLESSVSAEVGYFNQRGLSIYFDKSLEKLGFEEGDKVKVLIVKEE